MKTSLNCYAKRYLNNKQSNSRKYLNYHIHPKTSPLTITTISHKTSKSKTKTHMKNHTNTSLTEASLDTETNNNIHNTKAKSLSYIPQSNRFIISAYEQSLIYLFSYLKDILDDSKYQRTKKAFFEELEKNLLTPSKNEYSSYNKTSTLSSSNSIMSMLQESKQKCCVVLQSNNNGKCSYTNAMKNKSFNMNKQNFKSHKSLYTLSKPGKTVNTSSPDKTINTRHSFLHHYYKSFHTHNNGIGKQKEKEKSNNNNTINISVPNIINNLDYQMKGYLYKDYCNKNENKTYNDDMLNYNKHHPQEENTSELLSQIKNSLDDNLKGFFEFSYENFLNKETERECTNRSRIPNK